MMIKQGKIPPGFAASVAASSIDDRAYHPAIDSHGDLRGRVRHLGGIPVSLGVSFPA